MTDTMMVILGVVFCCGTPLAILGGVALVFIAHLPHDRAPAPIPGQRWQLRGIGPVLVLGVTPPHTDNGCWEGSVTFVTVQGARIQTPYWTFRRAAELIEDGHT